MSSPPDCIACSAQTVKLYRTRMLGAPWMHGCPACGLCAVAPLPTETDEQYEDAYTASPDANRKNRRLAFDYLQKIEPYLPAPPFSFLEVGGAYGWLAESVRDRFGADVLLLEPGRTAVEAARARGLRAESGFLEQCEGDRRFDVLCATHVLEHVRDIRAFLEGCRLALRPGGVLLLLTPNARAWKLEKFGRAWAWAVPEQHTFLVSAEAMRRLLEAAGFRVIELKAGVPAFAHYPFLLARVLAEWRARLPALLRRASGLLTRPFAVLEYAALRAVDSCIRHDRADELLIVASRRE